MKSHTAFKGLRLPCLIVAGTLLAAGCASTRSTSTSTAGTTSAKAETQAGTTAAVDPDGMRCKRVAETGSRMKKKVCATNREWDISERAAQKAAEDYQRSSAIGRSID